MNLNSNQKDSHKVDGLFNNELNRSSVDSDSFHPFRGIKLPLVDVRE